MTTTTDCKHGIRHGECERCHPQAAAASVVATVPPRQPMPPPAKRDGARATVLRAARELAAPFTEADLLLAAWRRDLKAFGLSGHHGDHPDARRLAVCLFGARGLLRLGLLVRRGDGLLEVEEGRA